MPFSNDLVKILLASFTSLVVTLFILPRLASIALKIGLLDYPTSKRKVHKTPKPLVGGIGMIIGVLAGSLAFSSFQGLRGFYMAVAILGVIGFLDDFREISYRYKFAAQIIAAGLMIYVSNVVLLSFGDLLSFGPLNLGILAVPVTIFATVGVINAVNMIDGLDGLAGGVSLIAFMSFAILAFINGQPELGFLSFIIAGALLGFLRHNWNPSKLFMGDAGSLFLGFSLAFMSIAITQKENSGVPPVAALLILAVPIVDTLTIMTKRMIKGRSPFYADKYHMHHILMRLGLGKVNAVKAILFLSAIFSVIAISGTVFGLPDYYLFLIFILYFAIHFTASFYIKAMVKMKGMGGQT